ncbi:MAG: DUF993 family protein [Ilumatobacteraceae bacterium]
MTVIYLPDFHGGHRSVELRSPRDRVDHDFTSRVAFAAPHVVADWRSSAAPDQPVAVDWDATLGFRRHLFGHGLRVAEATNTAQRNNGLDWPAVQELIRRSALQAHEFGERIVSGAGTDHRCDVATLTEVGHAYGEQVEFVESTGSQVVVLASRQLAAAARGADDYLDTYEELLERVSEPVILQWPDEHLDPTFGGYWGSTDLVLAAETFLALVAGNAAKVDGVQVPRLGCELEAGLRTRFPDGVRVYTGNEIDYPAIIKGDGAHHSDALLVTFAAAAPAAAAAMAALDHDDIETYDQEMDTLVELSRHLVEPPTACATAGIAFLAWLCGHQDGFTVVGGLQAARSAAHLVRAFELANEARLFPDPDLAADRLLSWLDVAGVQL